MPDPSNRIAKADIEEVLDRLAVDSTMLVYCNFNILVSCPPDKVKMCIRDRSWAGSNLNQSVRRVNELAVAGLPSPGYVNEVLLPSIQDVQNILKRIKDDLETLNNRTRLIK